MKLASEIRPRSGKPRHVTVHGKPYAFAQVEDKAGNIHFVADVRDPEHAAVLLGSGHFYRFGADVQKAATLTRTGADADATATKAPEYPPEIVDEATELLEANTDAIGVAIGKVSGLDVIRCALALEAAGQARKGVTGLLTTALESALAAGVK